MSTKLSEMIAAHSASAITDAWAAEARALEHRVAELEGRLRTGLDAKGLPMTDETPEHIMQFFHFEHLPPNLQKVSRPFALLAQGVEQRLPRNPERTVALRKLLEAKDAAVRALVAK